MTILGLLLAATIANAPTPQWEGASRIRWSHLSGTEQTDWTNHVMELRDGSVFATGFVNRGEGDAPPSWDLVAQKFSSDGTLVWSRRIGGPALDAGWVGLELADGRVAIAGVSASGSAGSTDGWLLVLDGDGGILIDRRYGGDKEDFFTGIAPAADGGFLMTGWTQSAGAGGRDVLLVRTDKDGNELWRQAHGGPDADRGFYVKPVNGGYVIAGVTGQPQAYDFLLMKVDDLGAIVWRAVHGGPANEPTHGLAVLPDGRILLIGYSGNAAAGDYDLAALTFSPDGRLLRHETLAGPGDDRAQFAALASDGSVWVTGYTKSFGKGDWDVLVAKVRPDGSFERWLGAIASPHDDNGSVVAVARNGDLLISGYSAAASAGAAPPDGLVMRLDPASLVKRRKGVTRRVER